MKISRIQIDNILGTKHADFKPGTLTVLRGLNGTGKTSILDALRRVFEGGSDPQLLRRGAKFGQVLLTLDDGTTISVRVTKTQTTYEITDPEGREVKAPRAYITELGDAMAVDPTRLLKAADKDIAQALLEIMPVEFTAAELQACFPTLETEIEGHTEELPAQVQNADLDLEGLSVLYKSVEEERRLLNRSVRDAEGLERNLRAGLKEVDSQDWAARTKELRKTLAEAESALQGALEKIAKDERETLDGLREQYDKYVNQAKLESAAAANEARNEGAPELQRLHQAIATAEEKQRERDRLQGVRTEFDHVQQKLSRDRLVSDAFTVALDNLKDLRQKKLEAGPIPGLVVIDGVAFYEGIAWQHVNTARKVEILLQIGSLRSGKLPFLIIDDSEKLDPETWEAFRAGALTSGFQVICARVGDKPLKIETLEPEQEQQESLLTQETM